MAERRMLAKTITESDAFLDMPQSTQNLYFHLNMNADDDGFVNNPKKIQRVVGSSTDDLKLLMAKSFLIPFDSGVVVIKHWRIHNYIRSDRYKPTAYVDERRQLTVKDNGSYTMATAGIPSDIPDGNNLVDGRSTQVRLGKDSIGEDSIDEKKTGCFQKPTIDEVRLYCKERQNRVDPTRFIDFYDSKGWMIGKSKMKDWRAAVRNWERNDAERNPEPSAPRERPRCECGGEFNPGGFCTKCGREIS